VTSSAAFRLPSAPMSKESLKPATPSDDQMFLSPATDEALMTRMCAGDKEALAELFHRYARIVRGVAYKVLRDSSEADDLLQDIFILIQRKCSMFNASRGSARFWILQMTYHRSIMRRRYLNSRHFYTRVDLEDLGGEPVAPGTELSRFADSGNGLLAGNGFQKCLEALSENQRQTLLLFFVEGLTLSEIAIKLKQPRGRVKNHYFRGLDRLRRQICGKNQRELEDK
jgi:RNA polymerase sigma-70 factor (ECF subfamily)